MNRSQIITKLIKEGFSERTLLGFNDKQIQSLSKRFFVEQSSAPIVNIPKDDNNAIKTAQNNKQQFVAYEEKEKGKDPKSKETSYKGFNIEKLHPSGYFEFYSKKDGRFKKADTMAGVKKMIDGEGGSKKSEVKEDKQPKKDKFFDIESKKGKNIKFDDKEKKESAKKDLNNKKKSNKFEDKKVDETVNWVEKIVENKYHSLTTKNEIMDLINSKLNEQETMVPMPKTKAKKGHNGIPEFMTYNSIKKSASPQTKPSPGTNPAPTIAPGKPDVRPKPKTPYQPGPGQNPSPKAGTKPLQGKKH